MRLKAFLKWLLYVSLSLTGLALLVAVGMIGLNWWQYYLPSDQRARRQFEDHKAEFVRFAALLRQDPRPRVINENGLDDVFQKGAREVPEYRELMRRTGAKAVYVRSDGSLEFELWGYGCAPCTDSFKGVRYSPLRGKPQTGFAWVPKIVSSLESKDLPTEKGAVSDGLYVIPLDPDWSIYRLEIGN